LYNYCNICNIPIYFCNIHLKHLQYISKTPETLSITLLLGQMELAIVELDDSIVVNGGALSSSVHQRRGEHCEGEHHLCESMSTPGE
jgi:hypothetical protein